MIGAPGDEHERQADRTAAERMAAPDSRAAPPRIAHSPAPPAPGEVPASVGQTLARPGSPLEPAVRHDMERRFGYDFSRVRIHTDGADARSARDVGARAYTVGHHLVFAAGSYAPSTRHGGLLLAHELAHTVQQSAMAGAPRLQRTCNQALGAPSPDCAPTERGAAGWQLLFKVGCDELLPGEEAKIDKLKVGSQLNIHGFASRDGPEDFNDALSCHRANRIAELVRLHRADCPVIGIFKHGEFPVSAPGVAKDANPPGFWRSVIIEEVRPALESGEAWLDPTSNINNARALLRRAKADPTPANLALVSAKRGELKTWLTSIGRSLAPQGTQLTRRNLDDYRRFYTLAEEVWKETDQLLALHKHADAAKDTYTGWAVGPGKDQGDAIHAKGVPAAKYHIDIFGEGYFKGAVNIGDAERTSTTGIHDSRVPNLIYRHFSGKDASLPIADHVADLVTSENGPLRIPGLAEEIARIIAPGGTVVLVNPSSEEFAHDRVAKAVGGVAKKVKTGDLLQTTIIAPGP